MATKQKNLYLYLTIACFVGLIVIFIVDGYMGVYDALYVPMGEREEKVEADQWEEWSRWGMAEVGWGDKAHFRYEVDNRQFSDYSANISVSVWHSKEKVQDLISQEISIPAFDKGQLEWSIDSTELLPAGVSLEGRPVEYTVIIKRGEIERKVIFTVFGYAKVEPSPPG
jgi:hypothetical protein